MAQKINCDAHPEAGQAGEPHGLEDNALADAELMVWSAKAAVKMAERNLCVAYETLASVLSARNNGALADSPLSSAAGLAGGPGDDTSEPDAPG